ncbi:MAG: ABC transporter substrate-binding protein, partial [Thermoleophilaceae bacterium]
GVKRPRDLEGKRVGVTGLPSDDAVLRAVVEADGGSPKEVATKTIGFSAVPSLIAGKVDAVVSFWNAEGVALRERGVRTREFRLGEYGAPSYPELVLAVRRETLTRERELVAGTVAALREGTQRVVKGDREQVVREIARAGGADAELVDAQLQAVLPAFPPALDLRRRELEGWARFDARFGILERRPSVTRAFALPQP